jgi:hypothetical protein
MSPPVTFEDWSEQLYLEVRRFLVERTGFARWLVNNAHLFGGLEAIREVQLLLGVHARPHKTLRLIFPRFNGDRYQPFLLRDNSLEKSRAWRHAHAQMNYSFEMGVDPLCPNGPRRGLAWAAMEAGECYYHHDAEKLGNQVVTVGTISAKSANPSAHEPMGLKSFYYVPMPPDRPSAPPADEPRCWVALGLYSPRPGQPVDELPDYPDWAKELWEQPFFQCAAGLLANWDWAFEQSLHDALRALGSAGQHRRGQDQDPHTALLRFVVSQDSPRPQVCWPCEVIAGLKACTLRIPQGLTPCGQSHNLCPGSPIVQILELIVGNYFQAFPTAPRPPLEVAYRREHGVSELALQNSAPYDHNRLERYWMIRQGRPPAGRPGGRWGGYGLLLAQRAASRLGGDLRVDFAIPKDNEHGAYWSVTLRWLNS